MTLLITEEETRSVMSLSAAIPVIDDLFRMTGNRKTRNSRRIEMDANDGYLLFRAAVLPEAGVAGFKILTNFGTGPRQMWNHLYDIATGELLAIVQSAAISKLRTAAASAVAVRHLSPAGASVLGVYGTGRQAEAQIEAVSLVRDLARVQVYSRDPAKRQAFAEKMSARLNLEVVPAETPEAVPRGAGIVLTITNSETPVLQGAWLGDPSLVVAVGANEWYEREVDAEVVGGAALVVVDDVDDARRHSGDLLWAVEKGRLDWSDVVTLGDVIVGRTALPQQGHMLFESHGVAIEDVAITAATYAAAKAQGLGRRIEL